MEKSQWIVCHIAGYITRVLDLDKRRKKSVINLIVSLVTVACGLAQRACQSCRIEQSVDLREEVWW